MGRSLGGVRRIVGFGLLAVLAAPVLALGPAMVVDRGFAGRARVSAFPAALVVLDPLVWRCVRNSVVVAVAVTVGALAVGTGLGVLLARRRFWGRGLLGTLALVPLAVSPIWVAPGVVGWIGGEAGWSWLAARSFLGQPGDDWARWVALVWVGLAGATPLVILAVRSGLDRVDPAWADAARVVGAGRRRVWLDVTWPTIRPDLARVGGSIFALVLIEPAGPTILGLRRTLAIELADAAFRFADPNRAATLATIAVAITGVVRGFFARWGGPNHPAEGGQFTLPPAPRAGVRLGGFALGALTLWAIFAMGPVVGVIRQLGVASLGGHPLGLESIRLMLDGWNTPEVRAWVANSATTATLAVGLDAVLLLLVAGSGRRLARGLASVPPLALAVGALALPALAATWAAAATGSAWEGPLGALRAELSPGRAPGWLLVLVLAATRWPALVRASGPSDRAEPPEPVDAALLAGASTREARRFARERGRTLSARTIAIAWTWASTDLAAAWVLTALDERRTIAPAALDLLGTDLGAPDPRLLGLFVILTTVRLAGLSLILGRDRFDRAGRWLSAI